jgi:hypothetical protein
MKSSDRKRKIFGDLKLRKRINKFFSDCAREINHMHIEQGACFDQTFPNIQKLKTLSTEGERELTGVEVIRLVNNLRSMGVHPTVVTAYLSGFVDFAEFLRLVGKAVQTTTRDRLAQTEAIKFEVIEAIKEGKVSIH